MKNVLLIHLPANFNNPRDNRSADYCGSRRGSSPADPASSRTHPGLFPGDPVEKNLLSGPVRANPVGKDTCRGVFSPGIRARATIYPG